jgi:hypothetical protein
LCCQKTGNRVSLCCRDIGKITAMDEKASIPFPVRFDPFKHHRNYIQGILNTASADEIIDLLSPICNNYTDIYTGSMDPVSICDAVISMLKSNRCLLADDFTRWIASKNGYRKIKLEDQSEWIVRKGDQADRYIHIHPARTGPFNIRFKGTTLKTVYMLKTSTNGLREQPSLEMMNQIRRQIGLSPVKKLWRSKDIFNCFEIFFE